MKLYFSLTLVFSGHVLASASESTGSEKLCIDKSIYDEEEGDRSFRINLEGDGSYFGMVDMPMHPDGATEAWSLNSDQGSMFDGETYHFELYSSLGDGIFGFDFDFDEASSLPKINYLLNMYRATEVCGSTRITYKEVQQAIWSILDEESAEANPVEGA